MVRFDDLQLFVRTAALGSFSRAARETGLLPGTINTTMLDADCGPQIRLEPARADVRLALSNSFGFGGNNCSLIFGKDLQA